MPAARLSIRRKLVFSTLVLVAALSSAEFACRLLGLPADVDPAITDWRVQWSNNFYVAPEMPGFNPDGFRDRIHHAENPQGLTRVVCLGDSVTFGYTLGRRQSYPLLLERFLHEQGQAVEVFNMALPGWCTRQQRIAYHRIGRVYKPDHVIVGFCLNDVAEMQNNLTRPNAVVTFCYRHSNLVRLLMAPGRWEIKQVEELFHEPEAPRVRDAWKLALDELGELAREVEADGARFHLLVFPFRIQVEPDPPRPIPQQILRGFSEAEGIHYIDARRMLGPLGREGFIDYDHLSPSGAAAVARGMVETDALGLAAPSSP